MTIIVFSGNLGSGKTLAMSIMLYINYLSGSLAYANYKVTGYPVERITNTYVLKSLTKDWKTFALDEFYLDMDSRQSGKSNNIDMSRKILQFRKRNIDAFITSQSLGFLDNRLRLLVGLIVYPETIFIRDKPVCVVCHYTTNKHILFHDLNLIKKLPSFTLPVIIDGFNISEHYDTDEIVESLELEETEDIKDLIKKYKMFDGTKASLKSILNIEHKMNISKAGVIGDYIFYQNEL